MAQRVSGYERQPDELYETPEWVVGALNEHVKLEGLSTWEPCAASGKLARALEAFTQRAVFETDVVARPDAPPSSRTRSADFLTTNPSLLTIDAITTNPPYGGQGKLACAFIERGLHFLRLPPTRCAVRMFAYLLPVDFDSASSRTPLFRDCAEFAMTIRLLKRIRWFEGPSGPSVNHAWFVWQRPALSVPHGPVTRYAPTEPLEAPTPSLLLADL